MPTKIEISRTTAIMAGVIALLLAFLLWREATRPQSQDAILKAITDFDAQLNSVSGNELNDLRVEIIDAQFKLLSVTDADPSSGESGSILAALDAFKHERERREAVDGADASVRWAHSIIVGKSAADFASAMRGVR